MTPSGVNPQQQKILAEVAAHLWALGSANDAEDRNFTVEASRMRADACAALLLLLEAHPFLEDLLPALRQELDTGHILWFGWSTLLDSLMPHLSASEK